jgi:hypothetical protein
MGWCSARQMKNRMGFRSGWLAQTAAKGSGLELIRRRGARPAEGWAMDGQNGRLQGQAQMDY